MELPEDIAKRYRPFAYTTVDKTANYHPYEPGLTPSELDHDEKAYAIEVLDDTFAKSNLVFDQQRFDTLSAKYTKADKEKLRQFVIIAIQSVIIWGKRQELVKQTEA